MLGNETLIENIFLIRLGAMGGFKACGWVAGPVAVTGNTGISGGALLNLGYMALDKR